MIMNFLKKKMYEQVYQKRTLIVTQTDIIISRKNNRNLIISKLQNRHTIKDCLVRFEAFTGI